jgi:hypothetical protein
MDTVWVELIKALPWGFVILVLQYMNLKDKKEERIERALNAAEKSETDKSYDMEKNRLWSETIKYSIDKEAQSSQSIIGAIKEMQKDLQEKYESMGITKDLLDAARRELARQKKGD